MELKFWRYALALLPDMLIARLILKSRGICDTFTARPRDLLFSGYGRYLGSPLYHYFRPLSADFLRSRCREIAKQSELCLEHKRVIPGAGVIELNHPESKGELWRKVNRANLKCAGRIRRLIDAGYRGIDWYADLNSGLRHSPRAYYRDIRATFRQTARMDCLIGLACAFFLAGDRRTGFRDQAVYAGEFRNQVLDFISANPPRFGVNWSSVMDTGMRVANWLVAFDLFYAWGARFGADFEREFARSVYQHARHIAHNLGRDPASPSLQDLAAVAGLLFACAFLPCNRKTDVWLALAIQEVNRCGEIQSESTSSDTFAAETAAYATALVMGLPAIKRRAIQHYDCRLHRLQPPLKPAITYHYRRGVLSPFSDRYLTWMEQTAEAVIREQSRVAGNAGSAHFLHFRPPGEGNCARSVAALSGLFEREDFRKFAGNSPEAEIIRILAQNNTVPSSRPKL